MKNQEHIYDLKQLKETIEKCPSYKDYLSQNRLPNNFLGLTNAGVVSFDGTYASKSLRMSEIFFVANGDPFWGDPTNTILSVTCDNLLQSVTSGAVFYRRTFLGKQCIRYIKRNGNYAGKNHLKINKLSLALGREWGSAALSSFSLQSPVAIALGSCYNLRMTHRSLR